jgi:phage shock protein PspC (stress-responsive transcriptional regulator)
MFDQLVAFIAQVNEPAPALDADVVAGLAVALVVTVVVVRFIKVILFVMALAFLALVFVGFLHVEPQIAQFIDNIRAASGS